MTTRAYQAVIFDMDGVLVDTEPAFFDAVNVVLADEGRAIGFDRYRKTIGTSADDSWREIMRMLDLRGDLRDYLRRYGEVLLDCLAQPRDPLPGAVALLDELAERGVPHALATSTWRAWATVVLKSAGLQERFRAIVTGDEVAEEKPAPDIYLRAAELAGAPPEQCVAIEDTPAGIASAKAAGMGAVQVRGASTAFDPIEGADLVLETLADFPAGLLAGAA